MKLVTVFLSLTALIAFADDAAKDPKVFNGAYTLSEEGCEELSKKDFERAYISVGQDARKDKEIRLKFFGQDAREESILLGEGSRKPLGVAESSTVKETWKTTFKSAVHIVSKKTTASPRVNFEETAELEIVKDKVDVRYTYKAGKSGNDDFVCVLQPTLSEKQKKEVCKQIRINQPDLKEKLKDKNCLKDGNFQVDSNDESQLGLTYSNGNLREDEQFTCEVYFDKPMGDFAPAVEQCGFN